MVSLQQCEDNPDLAFKLNALLVDELVDAASSVNASLLHISTDHFYLGNANLLHKEDDPLEVVNVYAASKRAGELKALCYSKALVVRTNITGWRNRGAPTFIEYLYKLY